MIPGLIKGGVNSYSKHKNKIPKILGNNITLIVVLIVFFMIYYLILTTCTFSTNGKLIMFGIPIILIPIIVGINIYYRPYRVYNKTVGGGIPLSNVPSSFIEDYNATQPTRLSDMVGGIEALDEFIES